MRLSNFSVYFIMLVLLGCGSVKDDLLPSGSDKRPSVQQGTTGPAVGQNAPDFTVSDTLGNTVTLAAFLPSHRGVVLYFTMWCPTCDSHMSLIRDNFISQYPDVLFFAVDYVSGSVAAARNAEVSNGYAGSGFVVLADTTQVILTEYSATMGTTVVIDKNGIVQMNEDFKNGSKLQSVLEGLP
jgi:peroxiredoxin